VKAFQKIKNMERSNFIETSSAGFALLSAKGVFAMPEIIHSAKTERCGQPVIINTALI